MSSAVFLPIPFEPLTRQVAAPLTPAFQTPYWNRFDNPPLYERAVEFETCVLSLASAKAAISAAICAETTPYDRIAPHVRAVRMPGTPSVTFRIILGALDATAGTPISELGITMDTALSYIAADYVRHRFLGNTLQMPIAARPKDWGALLIESLVCLRVLHAELAPRVFV